MQRQWVYTRDAKSLKSVVTSRPLMLYTVRNIIYAKHKKYICTFVDFRCRYQNFHEIAYDDEDDPEIGTFVTFRCRNQNFR